ncbi:MAG: hypothetical protein SGJ21_09375 [Alphaproteobacteria bacterium]|nr:hypothetical protein [Alphaproteobacteria bacterium]
MVREVDQKKTRKALRKLRRAASRVEAEGGPGLTDWEKGFVEGVTGRLETYGSAFRDPQKGALDEALSARQARIVRVLDKKGRKSGSDPAPAIVDARPPEPPRPRSTFKRKTLPSASNARDIHADLDRIDRGGPPPGEPQLTAGQRRDALRIIPGGKKP